MEAFKKILRLGGGHNGSVFVRVEYDGAKLSLVGVEGPKANGDARGSCGQIQDHLDVTVYADGWDAEKVAKLREVWNKWHLNDMRAGCEHQRANWDISEKIEVVFYKLTSEAYTTRTLALARAARESAKGQTPELTNTERALILLDKWYDPPCPDADSPLSGCVEVKKREQKPAGWVKPEEHPRGLLCKPCEVCGYKYGSAWLKESVPADVLAWLRGLPDADMQPAWC